MSGILAYLLCSLLYAAIAFHFWRRHWGGGALQTPATARHGEQHWVLIPLALHSALLFSSMLGEGTLYLGIGNALSLILWLTVLVYWAGSLVHRLEGLQSLVLPIAAICVCAPLLLPAPRPVPYAEFLALKAHLIVSMLAYSLFTIASLHVLVMAVLEKRLHGGGLPGLLHNMPPLLTMELLLFRMIGAGFVLLTLALASGILFSEELTGRPLVFNHKTLFAILSWFVFGALLGGRLAYGWRGRTAVRWTLAGFLMLVLAYVGSKFVVEVILKR